MVRRYGDDSPFSAIPHGGVMLLVRDTIGIWGNLYQYFIFLNNTLFSRASLIRVNIFSRL